MTSLDVSDEASTWPPPTVPQGKSHGMQGRPCGYGQQARNEGARNVEGEVRAPSMLELLAQVQGLQQMVEIMVRAITNQGTSEEDPFIDREARHRERQVEPQMEVEAVTHANNI